MQTPLKLVKNFNHFLGSIVADPLEGVAPEARFDIQQGVFVPNDPTGSYSIHNLAHYNGAVLSVHFQGKTEGKAWATVEGSAFMVASGVAITAAHVIEDLIEYIMENGLIPYCVGYTPSGSRIWRMKHITKVNHTDLMLLSLEYRSPMPENAVFQQLKPAVSLPKIGEPIMVSGFHAWADGIPEADFPYFPVDGKNTRYGVDLRTCVGEVTAHRPSGTPHIRGPVIEVSHAALGGMSGGPAFDKDGLVVGVLSSSLPDCGEPGHSFVSLLAPSLAITIPPPNFLRLYSQEHSFRLLDLGQEFCGIEGRDHIRVSETETGEIRIEIDW